MRTFADFMRDRIGDVDHARMLPAPNATSSAGAIVTGKDAQIMKVKRVRDWMLDFIGDAPAAASKKKGRKARFMPDDTQ